MKTIARLLLFGSTAMLLAATGGLVLLLGLAGIPLSELPGLASLIFDHYTQ